jgi:hypothetical protein
MTGMVMAATMSVSIAEPAFPPLFSAAQTGGALPGGWKHTPLSKLKSDTTYELAMDGDKTVVKALANGSASALVSMGAVTLQELPVLTWRWKTPRLITGADNADPAREDAPVRVMVGFDGDKGKLPDKEQRYFKRIKMLSGRDMPYSLLMYIWENKAPVGTVIPSTHTARVQMIVAASGPQGVGEWQMLRRNVMEDYRRAFGEEPGKMLGVAIMTDTDNTGEKAEGWYGDIHFQQSGTAAR